MSTEPEVSFDSDESEINFITAVEIEQDLFSNGSFYTGQAHTKLLTTTY